MLFHGFFISSSPKFYFGNPDWYMEWLCMADRCTAKAIPFIYSFSGNCAASAPISTFMCLWSIYILPGLVHIFPPAETAAPSWEYIIRSQTHECRNWDWGPDIPFLGIFASNFRHFLFAVWYLAYHSDLRTPPFLWQPPPPPPRGMW